MEITWEVTLAYPEGSPDPNEASPTESDIENALTRGLANLGFSNDLDIIAKRQ